MAYSPHQWERVNHLIAGVVHGLFMGKTVAVFSPTEASRDAMKAVFRERGVDPDNIHLQWVVPVDDGPGGLTPDTVVVDEVLP